MPEKTRYPLSWPVGWPRTANLRDAPFRSYKRDLSISQAVDRLEAELDRLGAKEPMLSSNLRQGVSGAILSNQAEPADRGVAVYFKLRGKDRVLACDRYTSAAGNIAAIAAHIDALRRIERYGVGSVDQAFAGYTALEPPNEANRPPWRSLLGFKPEATVSADDVRVAFRSRAKAVATDEVALRVLNLARDAALQELGGR